MLATLARQPGRVVTKQDLFHTVWAGSVVTDSALSSCICELRRALEDDARNPRYIETVHRRGFRLLVSGTSSPAGTGLEIAPWSTNEWSGPLPGRGEIFARLEELAARASNAATEVALVKGSPGMGKTTLLRQFAAQLSRRDGWLVCEAACTDPADAYGPLIDVLNRLREGPAGVTVSSILHSQATSWLAELPHGQGRAEQMTIQRGSGATSQRRVRELCDALAAISKHQPLLICLDDLQRCDEEALNCIAHLARDSANASIMVLGSSETASRPPTGPDTSLLDELCEAGQCAEFTLESLDAAAIAECIGLRPAGLNGRDGARDRLERELSSCTGGWPLLVTALLDERVHTQGPGKRAPRRHPNPLSRPGRCEVAAALYELIQRRLNRLGDTERSTLEAASVVGRRFSASEVAAATGESVENTANALLRIQRASGLIFDGGPQFRLDVDHRWAFAFLHECYREAALEGVSPPRRTDIHRKVGRHLQQDEDRGIRVPACRVARHFERAGELDCAARHWYEAGAVARRRGSHGIALSNFRRAQVLLHGLPPSADRDVQTAKLCTAMARELVVTEGLNSVEANKYYSQALALSRYIPPSRELSQILWRSWVFYLNRGPLDTACELATTLFELARDLDDPAVLLQAHHAQWANCFHLGDLQGVLEKTRLGVAVCSSGVNGSMAMTTGCTLYDTHLNDHNAAICAGFFSAWADAIAGQRERANRNLDAVITHARDVDHAFTLCTALVIAAGASASVGNAGQTRLRAAEGRSIAQQQGFTALSAWAVIYEGWALSELGDHDQGLRLLREGLAAVGQFGMALFRPFHLALAAAAQMRCGLLEDASDSLAEALTVSEQSGHRFALPEIYRLRGEIALRTARDCDSLRRAQADLKVAAESARQCGARLWEERAKATLEAHFGSPAERPLLRRVVSD